LGTLIAIFCLIGFLLFWQGLIVLGQRIIEARRLHSVWMWVIGGPLSVCVGLGSAHLLIDPSGYAWWESIVLFLLLVGLCRNKFIEARDVW
jgi:hypothetical protein